MLSFFKTHSVAYMAKMFRLRVAVARLVSCNGDRKTKPGSFLSVESKVAMLWRNKYHRYDRASLKGKVNPDFNGTQSRS